jgi:diacylglycerol kinase family enzyme
MATLTTIHGGKREKVAVLLNANAKSVNEKLRTEIARFIPEQDVYYSRTLAEARAIAHQVIDRGYTTLLTGGGDGTFVGFVNEVLRHVGDEGPAETQVGRGGVVLRLRPQPRAAPRFGVLRLGTGNALAGMVGASPDTVGVVEDILRVRSGDVGASQSLYLLDAEGKRAPFAGLGVDAKVLNDYVAVKNTLGRTPFKALGHGLPGYLIAAATMSVPAVTLGKLARLTIVNEGGEAAQLGPDGREVGRPFGKGETLYEGPACFVGAGTVPYYGFGFTIFPHALRSPGRMHLRVSAMNVAQIVRNIPTLWKGGTPGTGMLDFHAERVRLRFDRRMPFQIGGDAEGYRDEVVLGMDRRPLDLIDFRSRA